MLIREWMTKNVVTVKPETSMLKASKLMKDYDIRRLPVVDDKGVVIGIVSDRDIKEASPSNATTLDAHELYYLLSELKIKSIMTANPITIREDSTVGAAAILMEQKAIGGLPVVDDAGRVVGIVTDHDIFKLLTDICGAKNKGIELALCLPDAPGVLYPIFEKLLALKANIFTILTSRSNTSEGTSHVYIKMHPMPKEDQNALIEAVRKDLPLEYWFDENNQLHKGK